MKKLTINEIRSAIKKLKRVPSFYHWFGVKSTPQQLIQKHCDTLGWTTDLKTDAQYIVDKVHSEFESCQPLVIVGLALYLLNIRVGEKATIDKRYARIGPFLED